MVQVELNNGEKVTLQKPTAGMRNKALIKADTADGIKRTVMMVEMLPYCIKSHPWGTRQIRDALDNLSIEDYDKIIDGLSELITPTTDKIQKKLNEPSDQDTSHKDGSVIK